MVLSHLHGDHFGGLPFLLLDAHHMSRRGRPLFIIGPKGMTARLDAACEALYPGMTEVERRYPLDLVEADAGAPIMRDGLSVTFFAADHSAGAPCHIVRAEMEGRVVTYSGDTAWTDALIEAGRGADLFICECSTFERPLKGHLSYAELAPRLASIGAKRVILTHMNPDMLARSAAIPHETASDGLTIAL